MKTQRRSKKARSSVLGAHISGFARHLERDGYTEKTRACTSACAVALIATSTRTGFCSMTQERTTSRRFLRVDAGVGGFVMVEARCAGTGGARSCVCCGTSALRRQ